MKMVPTRSCGVWAKETQRERGTGQPARQEPQRGSTPLFHAEFDRVSFMFLHFQLMSEVILCPSSLCYSSSPRQTPPGAQLSVSGKSPFSTVLSSPSESPRRAAQGGALSSRPVLLSVLDHSTWQTPSKRRLVTSEGITATCSPPPSTWCP